MIECRPKFHHLGEQRQVLFAWLLLPIGIAGLVPSLRSFPLLQARSCIFLCRFFPRASFFLSFFLPWQRQALTGALCLLLPRCRASLAQSKTFASTHFKARS